MRRRLDPTSPFDVLEAHFRALTAGPRPHCFDGTRVPGLPARPIPLEELRSLLLHPSTPYAVRDQTINALLERARRDGGPAMVGLAGVLLPGLRRAAWPLTQAHPDKRADLQAEILAGLITAAARTVPGRARPAARLTWAARRAADGLLRTERAEHARPAPLPSSLEPPAQHGHPDLVLARAVRAGVVCAADADLVGATRLGEHDLHTAADLAGVSYRAIRERRRRAETALVGWLTGGGAGFVAEPPAEAGSSRGGRPRHGRCPDRRSGVRQPTTTAGR